MKLYLQNVLEQKSKHINGTQIDFDTMVHFYGFNFVEEENKDSQFKN